jgi:hypothetical protein
MSTHPIGARTLLAVLVSGAASAPALAADGGQGSGYAGPGYSQGEPGYQGPGYSDPTYGASPALRESSGYAGPGAQPPTGQGVPGLSPRGGAGSAYSGAPDTFGKPDGFGMPGGFGQATPGGSPQGYGGLSPGAGGPGTPGYGYGYGAGVPGANGPGQGAGAGYDPAAGATGGGQFGPGDDRGRYAGDSQDDPRTRNRDRRRDGQGYNPASAMPGARDRLGGNRNR